MFREAIGYPTRPPEGGRAVILGGVLLIVIAAFVSLTGLGVPYGVLAAIGLVPWLLVRGYYVRVVRTTIGRETPTPPRLGNVRQLLKDGLTAAVISVAYLLPGAVVLGPLVALQALGIDLSTVLAEQSLPASAPLAITSLTGIVAVVAMMYVIGALYVLPVAVGLFAHSGSFGAAFEVRRIVSGAVTEDYAIAWGVSLALQLFLLPISYLLRIFVVGFFLQFIIAIGVRYCYGQGVGAALKLESVPAAHERSDPERWDLAPAVGRIHDEDEWRAANMEPTRSRATSSDPARSNEEGNESNVGGFQFGDPKR